MLIVPPGGFAGFSQMTAASRRALSGAAPRAAGTRRRRKKSGSRSKVASTGRSRKKRSGRKLKFGSHAWRKKYAKKARKKK